MARPMHPGALVDRLRSTYWFLPAVVTVAAIGLAVLLVSLDRRIDGVAWLGWAYSGGASGARALLSAVAGSTITVVSVTFSVLVVALTVSSQHFGPRLLNSFMRDHAAQIVLGTFTGTFAYCLVVLRTVRGEDGGASEFVPHLAVTTAVVLALVSLGMLIYYVHHVAVSMQVSAITAGVAHEFERTIERLYPEPIGTGTEPPVHEPPPRPAAATEVTIDRSGYVESVDDRAVLRLAVEHDAVVWLTSRPGDFVVAGTPIASVHPPPADGDRFAADLSRAYAVAADRNSYQDVAFAIQQLVEVGLRALSPGVNEPFTAITVVDRLGQGLIRLAGRRLPSALRLDDEGRVRVVAAPSTFPELLTAAFEPIALYADRNPAIAGRLLQTLRRLAAVVHQPDAAAAIRECADFVRALAAGQLQAASHRAFIDRLHGEVVDALARRAPAAPAGARR